MKEYADNCIFFLLVPIEIESRQSEVETGKINRIASLAAESNLVKIKKSFCE